MALLSDDELNLIRTDLDAILPGTCHILTPTHGTTSTGGGTITWGTASTVACDIHPFGNRLGEEVHFRDDSGELIAQSFWEFTLPAETSVDESNHIKYEGVVYQVDAVLGPVATEMERRVIARKVAGD